MGSVVAVVMLPPHAHVPAEYRSTKLEIECSGYTTAAPWLWFIQRVIDDYPFLTVFLVNLAEWFGGGFVS